MRNLGRPGGQDLHSQKLFAETLALVPGMNNFLLWKLSNFWKLNNLAGGG